MSDWEATSELSLLVHESVGYDEVFPSGCKPGEDSPRSLERESSTQSLSDDNEEEDEGYVEGDDEGEEDEEDEEDGEDDEDDKGARFEGRDPRDREDGGARPFILPAIWIVNDFYLTISSKVFNVLQDRYQIPEHIPIRLLRKFEKFYSGKTVDVGIYDAMFAAGLRQPYRPTLSVGQLFGFVCQPNSPQCLENFHWG